MALAQCNTTVDSQGRELVQHGTARFPVACYHDDFRIMDVPWHWHEEWEAVLLTAGSCLVAAGSEKRLLHRGEGFFINSGILHGCWDVENSGCRFHSVVFHPRLVGGSLDSVFYQSFVQPLLSRPAPEFVVLGLDIPWQKSALAAIEDAWQACSQEPAGFQFEVRSALSRLVFQLHSSCPIQPSGASGKSLRDADRIKLMLGFIHEHFGEELCTAAIAASATISESECLRCFRATIGTTPIRYLRQYRIQQAAKLLTDSQDRISDIAVHCGFQDMSYFTKSFREELGVTPTEYRRSDKNANR